MNFAEAIMICNNITADSIGGREIGMDTKLHAVEKILSMETINAVKKDTLRKVIRWFWDNCWENCVETEEKDDENTHT